MAALLAAGCTSNTIVDEERTFNADVWNRFTPEVFEVDIANAEDYFNIDFTVSVDTAHYRYTNVPLTVNLYSPDGERRMFYATVYLQENGRWRGEAAEGGRRTVGQRIRSFFSFNKSGRYRLEVGQATSQYDLEGVHSIGVYIERTKVDYDID